MRLIELQEWRDQITLTRDLTIPGERKDFYDRVRNKEFVRLLRGAYISNSIWSALTPDERYRARVRAAAALAKDLLLVSHASSAALWRLPWIDPWPRQVHVIVDSTPGGRSSSALVRHTLGSPADFTTIDGIAVTSLAQTVVDVARSHPFALAVAVADAALRRTQHPIDGVPRTSLTRDDLVATLEAVPLRQGTAMARRVIEFADGNADRPGESVSRVNMALARLPMPELQVPIYGASGRRWTVDFWWPEFNLIGEFDGIGKYTEPEFLRGRTPEQALIDEKDREDDLRATGRRMSRWRWNTAKSPTLLKRKLIQAGLR